MKRPEPKTAKLTFEETDYKGCEVRTKLTVPFDVLYELEDLDEEKGFKEALGYFVENIILDWNLEEDDGSPTPVSLAGLLSWPPDFSLLLMDAWRDAALKPPTPLSQPLKNGNEGMDLSLDSLSVIN